PWGVSSGCGVRAIIAGMSDILYRNRFRIPSTRLLGWDYSRGGTYCVTICTRDRVCWLGEISEGRMVLSGPGDIVSEEWEEMARRRPQVDLDAWIVMPNHIHGIVCLDPPRLNGRPTPLGEMIGQFKAACSRRIWGTGQRDFAWQPRFYDQIIRSDDVLQRFRRYIVENPLRWEDDKHHPNAVDGR
ncbi:MAG TPA: transposase, partial [Thermoanaerobaculia bacterium]|nr:transposase [Thermoanaerobaculia bacterium]